MTWSRLPLKHLAEISVSNVDKKSVLGEIPARLVNYTDVYYGDRLSPALDLLKATVTPSQMLSFRLKSGDVVITKDSETADDIGVAAYVDSADEDVVLGYHLALLRPRPSFIQDRYLYWTMCGDDVRGQLETGATGITRFGLRTDVIGSVRVSIPRSVKEQRTIADFLDTETARIDALISKKRRMIGLLAERDSALIEIVLCGAAVETIPLRRLLMVLPKYGAGETGVGGEDAWPRYIRITDLTDLGTLRSEGVLRLQPEVAAPFLLEDGDLLLARSGATVGKAFLYQRRMGHAAFAGYLIQFRADQRKVLPELLEVWTRTRHYWSQVRLASLQATIENVSAEKYKDFHVPNVPRRRQEAVLAELRTVREKSRLASNRLHRQVNLLEEHRSALVTAAVTGELVIPGLAA